MSSRSSRKPKKKARKARVSTGVKVVRIGAVLLALGLLTEAVFIIRGGGFSSSASSSVSEAGSKAGSGDANRMSVVFKFDGVKTKWGYSGWAQDGSVNPKLNKGIWGDDLTVHGKVFKHGIGTHAKSEIVFGLEKQIRRFSCLIGADAKGGSSDKVFFQVLGDGKELFKSNMMTVDMDAAPLDLDVTGVQELSLKVDYAEGDSWGHADWLDLKFTR